MMQILGDLLEKWLHGFVTSRHVRVWTVMVGWLQLTIVLLGRGLKGLFSNGMGNPYSSTVAEYRKIDYQPGKPIYIPGTAVHGSASIAFWHVLWSVWLFVTVLLLIQLFIEFGEEIGRGWRRVTERESADVVAAPTTTPGSAVVNAPARGSKITPLNILELDVAAEFLGEALFRAYRRLTGGAKV